MATIAELLDQAFAYHQGGDLSQAESLYRQILQADPGHADAHHLLGFLADQNGNPPAAIRLIRQAIALKPTASVFHFNLGTILEDQGQLAEAIDCYRCALRLYPNYVDALGNLSKALYETGQVEEAVECFHQVLRLNPNHAQSHNNLGNYYKDQGQWEEAIACYRQALNIKPEFVEALSNLGVTWAIQGRPSEAIEYFEQALQVDPRHASARFNHALQRLLIGDFLSAWPDFECRWQVSSVLNKIRVDGPRWDGSSLHGKTILIYAEQGLGDALQFIRYAPLVKERGGTILFRCHRALARLLAVEGVDQLITAGEPLPPFDVQAPLMSLPGIFGTTLSTIPRHVPYVRADEARVEYWRQELDGGGSISPMGPIGPIRLIPLSPPVTRHSPLKVGIAWQGNPQFKYDRYRSLPLTHFDTLGRLPGVRLVSLQIGPGKQQLKEVSFPVTDLGSLFDPNSMDDLAAGLMNMDLVVTSDNGVAHLAGALGVPVWVALPFAPDWRWLLDRTDSPWYPTMRLFRQSKFGEWRDVFEKIATELQQRSEK